MLSAVRAKLSSFLPQGFILPSPLQKLNVERILISAIPDHPFKAIRLGASGGTLTQKAVLNFFEKVRLLQNEGEEVLLISCYSMTISAIGIHVPDRLRFRSKQKSPSMHEPMPFVNLQKNSLQRNSYASSRPDYC
ncbi:MAG: hypothetical protein K1000chlam4_00207 [Chlamydiae bacterium]|nr:hypothetical protein [Chlamydiota bacterium]